MLAIRMQRTGRHGHASFRVVVQDSHLSPKSGKFVALLGSYDPHLKTATIDKEKAELYLKNGAQPSQRVARLFKEQSIKLPDWVTFPSNQSRGVKKPEKLRKNRPAEEVKAEAEATVAEPEVIKEKQKEEETVKEKAAEAPEVKEAEPEKEEVVKEVEPAKE